MDRKPNISIINALIRITCGFTFLSWSTAKMVKKPWKNTYLLVAMLSGMKIAEGILRYCPVTDAAEQAMKKNDSSDQGNILPDQY